MNAPRKKFRAFTDDLVKTLKLSNKARACLKSCAMSTKEFLIALKEAPSQYSVGPWKAVLERISHLLPSSKQHLVRIENSEYGLKLEKQLHQARQLARYTGVYRTLSKLCRQYSENFAGLEIVYVPPYRTASGAWRSSMTL